MVSVHQSPADCKASAPICQQPETYVLTKVSKAGVRYFYTGRRLVVELANGSAIPVARTSLFVGDAEVFDRSQGDDVLRIVAYFNLKPVSDAVWTAVRLSEVHQQWGAA